MKRRNQLAILGGSALLAISGVGVASAMTGDDGTADPVPVQNVAVDQDTTSTTIAATSTTTMATTVVTTTTVTPAPVDPGPVAPAPAGASIEQVVANHEERITDLEEEPAPTTQPPTTSPPATAPPTTTPATTTPPTTEAHPPRPS